MGRRRARKFAVQLSYSFEGKIAVLRSNLKKISVNPTYDASLSPHSIESAYARWVQEEPRTDNEKKQRVAQMITSVRGLQPDLFIHDLWDAQLELPTLIQERRLLDKESHQILIENELDKIPLPSLVSSLCTKPNVLELYRKILHKAEASIQSTGGSPSNLLNCVVAYWSLEATKKYKSEQLEDVIDQLVVLFLLSYHHEITIRGVREILEYIVDNSDILEGKTLYDIAEELEYLQGSTAEHIIELEFEPELNFSTKTADPGEIQFAEFLVRGVINNLTEIDGFITDASKSWTIDRMAMIDLCILRIGTFELLKCSSTPIAVIIDESIELAKCFSELGRARGSLANIDKGKQWNSKRPDNHNLRINDSSGFINGVLDNISKKIRTKRK